MTRRVPALSTELLVLTSSADFFCVSMHLQGVLGVRVAPDGRKDTRRLVYRYTFAWFSRLPL